MSASLAARLAKDDRREEWQRRLIEWGAYQRAELMHLPTIAPSASPPDWYAPLCSAIDSLPPEHAEMLRRFYLEGDQGLPHKRALNALLALLDKS